jgi:hypothetical protein
MKNEYELGKELVEAYSHSKILPQAFFLDRRESCLKYVLRQNGIDISRVDSISKAIEIELEKSYILDEEIDYIKIANIAYGGKNIIKSLLDTEEKRKAFKVGIAKGLSDEERDILLNPHKYDLKTVSDLINFIISIGKSNFRNLASEETKEKIRSP